jgi:hypothetical protein
MNAKTTQHLRLDIPLACRCGALRGLVRGVVSAQSNRSVCMCGDCQAFAHFLGRADVLDANGGSDVLPVAPCDLQISHGEEHMKCVRLSAGGMFRWYAGCCNTPIANSMASWKVPFAGLSVVVLDMAASDMSADQALGPVRARIMMKAGIPPLPADARQNPPAGFMLRIAGFMISGLLRGKHRPSPFFDGSGNPTVEPHVLSAAERDALRKLCGPIPA